MVSLRMPLLLDIAAGNRKFTALINTGFCCGIGRNLIGVVGVFKVCSIKPPSELRSVQWRMAQRLRVHSSSQHSFDTAFHHR